jgi:hypothetical protein
MIREQFREGSEEIAATIKKNPPKFKRFIFAFFNL